MFIIDEQNALYAIILTRLIIILDEQHFIT